MWFKKTMGVLVALMLLLAACQPSASESPSASDGAEASVESAAPGAAGRHWR